MAAKRGLQTSEQIRNRVNEAIAMDPDLDGVDLRVFLYLSSRVGFEDYIHVPQIELATVLGRHKTHISRAIRKLTENGVIVPSPKGARASEWRLNPDYGRVT